MKKLDTRSITALGLLVAVEIVALPLLLHQRLGSEDRLQLPASGGRSHAARTAGGRRSGRRERLRRGGAVSHRGVFPRLHPDGLSLRPRVRVAATPPPNGGPRSGCGPAPPAGAGPAHQLVLDLRPVQRTLCPLLGTRVLQCAVLAPVEFLTIGILAGFWNGSESRQWHERTGSAGLSPRGRLAGQPAGAVPHPGAYGPAGEIRRDLRFVHVAGTNGKRLHLGDALRDSHRRRVQDGAVHLPRICSGTTSGSR